VDALSRDLIAYYDQEAKLRSERQIDARRVACQQRFAQLLVNKNNLGMLGCSRRVKPRPDEALLDDSYIMFVAP
jgi:hypothetical protein